MKISFIQRIKANPKYIRKKNPTVAKVEYIKNNLSLDTGIPNLAPILVSVPNHFLSVLCFILLNIFQ